MGRALKAKAAPPPPFKPNLSLSPMASHTLIWTIFGANFDIADYVP